MVKSSLIISNFFLGLTVSKLSFHGHVCNQSRSYVHLTILKKTSREIFMYRFRTLIIKCNIRIAILK